MATESVDAPMCGLCGHAWHHWVTCAECPEGGCRAPERRGYERDTLAAGRIR